MLGGKALYTKLIVLLIIIAFGWIKYNHVPRNYFAYDNFGTYLYLPGLFIYNDLGWKDFSTLEQINAKYDCTPTYYQLDKSDTGNWVIRFFYGMSFLFLPFFLIGHLIALWGSYPADGFSLPYQLSVFWGGFIYLILGIIFLFKILSRYFSATTSIFTLFIIYFGTNYFFLASMGNDSPHVFLFTLYTLVIWFTIRWHENHKLLYAILLGFFLAILILARPSEIFSVFIPLLWGIYDRKSLITKIELLKQYRKHLISLVLVMLIMAIPQLVYWKVYTGKFFFSPLTNPQMGFDFLTPHFHRALFGFRKGIFIYSPLLLLGYVGLIFLYRRSKRIFWAFFFFLIFNTYLISSHSGLISFGWRAFVQSYAVLAIPLGFMVSEILSRKIWLKILIVLIIFGFIALNLFQSWQWSKGILHGSRMTRDYYFAVFGTTAVTEKDKGLLLVERSSVPWEYLDEEKDYKYDLIYDNSFEEPETKILDRYDTNMVHSGEYSLRMDGDFRFSPSYRVKFKNLTDHYYAWVRASVWIYPVAEPLNNEALLVITFSFNGKSYKYRAASMNHDNFTLKMNQWNLITRDYMTPEPRTPNDEMQVYVWYRGQDNIYIDDLKVELFEPLE